MMDGHIITKFFFFILIVQFLCGSALAQENVLDPSGYVLKYKQHFTGIGPRVYVLPAPRTKKQELTDTYKAITLFQDSVDKALRFQKLAAQYRSTSNHVSVLQILHDDAKDSLNHAMLVQHYIDQNNYSIAYGLLNELAKEMLFKGNTGQVNVFLQKALHLAQLNDVQSDIAILQSNMSTSQLISLNATEAGKSEEAFYAYAVKNKSLSDQAVSLVKLAQIQALDKDYKLAENTIIRKAIPLFNRGKYYEGKIWALEVLADIYQAQNRHTEAQWFLIQARDLARKREFTEKLAEIEYMLAFSKYEQKNYKVAKEEFISAYELADKEDNNLLKIAIVEKLGQINLLQNNIDVADKLLSEYWSLRSDLFKKI